MRGAQGDSCTSLCPSEPSQFGVSRRKLAQRNQESKVALQPGENVTETEREPLPRGVHLISPEICFGIQGRE